jgi:hypothetical protein
MIIQDIKINYSKIFDDYRDRSITILLKLFHLVDYCQRIFIFIQFVDVDFIFIYPSKFSYLITVEVILEETKFQ